VRVRKLTAGFDFSFGNGSNDYWQDVPDGVAQLVQTRLLLNLGEFFLDVTDGTAWATQVLGAQTAGTRDAVVYDRVNETTGVDQITEYYSYFNHATRQWEAQVTLSTLYGVANVLLPLAGSVASTTQTTPPPTMGPSPAPPTPGGTVGVNLLVDQSPVS